MKRGFLIAIEGIDGSGKSTQVARLCGALRDAGRSVVETREPTRGPYGQRIRAMVQSGKRVPPAEELQWFLEDRREHVRSLIAPALEDGKVVITDRYFLSTAAYQGARGLDAQAILSQCEVEFPLPDVAFLLNLDVSAGLARVHQRGALPDGVFEIPEYLEKVSAAFCAFDRPYIVRIDASRDAGVVHREMLRRLKERLSVLWNH